jgi:tRNA modification GTPase
MQPTTASLQTPAGRGGIAVIGLDGPRTAQLLRTVFRPLDAQAPSPDRLRLGELHRDGETIDQAIVLERDSRAEINIHGGPQAARATLDLLRRHGAEILPPSSSPPGGLPVAHPRWRNPAIGRELLERLPDGRSVLATALLTHQWSGGLSEFACETLERLRTGRTELTDAQACREAAARLEKVRRLLCPAEVVLAGPPNAGKSTLMNRLVGREVSLVHDRPGTTRDWVREPGVLDGVPVWLTDTAGLWEAPDEIDAEAVRRAHARAAQADVVVLIGAGQSPGLPSWWRAKSVVPVAGKCDVYPAPPGDSLAVSGATGRGVAELKTRIKSLLALEDLEPAAPAAFTGRQAEWLLRAGEAIEAGEAPRAVEAMETLLGRGSAD